MPKKKEPNPLQTNSSFRPALSPEARENQMISLAVDCAEQQLRDGTASAQVVVHYLKLASLREKEHLEVEALRKKIEYMDAKIESIQSAERIESLYKEAMDAMKEYKSSD